MPEENCKNILVRGVNWIGDAVMTLPALSSIKLSNPDSKIILLVKPWVSELFEKNPNVDEIILYTDEHKGIIGKFQLAKKLKQYNFRTAFLFQNALDAAFITFLAGIPERIGYSRDSRHFLLTKAVPFDSHARKLHHVEYYLNMLNAAGIHTEYSFPWIYLSLEERLKARDKIKEMKKPVVAINPGAAYGSSKRWHQDRFAEIAGRVSSEMNGSAVIIGGGSETGIAEEIVKKLNSQKSGSKSQGAEDISDESKLLTLNSELLNLSGKTSLRELAAIISECDILVTNDSGPMHIGYAVGTSVLAIFGSTSPELTGPVGNNNIAIKKELSCSPCFERECRQKDLRCMEMITSDEVFLSLKTLVKPKRAVFFDRDGTLCKDTGYLNNMEDLEIFPEISKLKRLKEKGLLLIGISNQSGIAKGLVKEAIVKQVNSIFTDKYGFDGFYYCPHHPDKHCSCRKPEPGLLLQAGADFKINLRESFVVGDKETDMLLARTAGAKGILVKTAQDSNSVHADFIAKDIGESVSIILENI